MSSAPCSPTRIPTGVQGHQNFPLAFLPSPAFSQGSLTAARYTNGPPALRNLPPLCKPDGQLTSEPAEQAKLLFQATSVPTIPCDLSDVNSPTPRQHFNDLFKQEEITVSIKHIKLGKAPGLDGITNQVIKEAPEALAIILASLLNACAATGNFLSQWKQANTIILNKPSKPDYTSATAY